jgi:hypothetical protein
MSKLTLEIEVVPLVLEAVPERARLHVVLRVRLRRVDERAEVLRELLRERADACLHYLPPLRRAPAASSAALVLACLASAGYALRARSRQWTLRRSCPERQPLTVAKDA